MYVSTKPILYFTSQFHSREMGDISLGWSEDQAAMMEEVIQKKMDEGYSFFIIDDGGREVRVKKIADLEGRRSITIGDKDAEALIKQGKIGIVDVSEMIDEPVSETETKPARRAKSAKEAATSQTVATRRMGGG